MGQIQLKVAALTATSVYLDADMTKVLNLVFDAHNGPAGLTSQERLNFTLQIIVNQLINDAKYQHARNKRQEAESTIVQEGIDIKL